MSTMNRRAIVAAIALSATAAASSLTAAPDPSSFEHLEQTDLTAWARNFAGDLGAEAARHAILAGYDITQLTGAHKDGIRPSERKRVVLWFDGDCPGSVDSNGTVHRGVQLWG